MYLAHLSSKPKQPPSYSLVPERRRPPRGATQPPITSAGPRYVASELLVRAILSLRPRLLLLSSAASSARWIGLSTATGAIGETTGHPRQRHDDPNATLSLVAKVQLVDPSVCPCFHHQPRCHYRSRSVASGDGLIGRRYPQAATTNASPCDDMGEGNGRVVGECQTALCRGRNR